jgi:hypothetical protein
MMKSGSPAMLTAVVVLLAKQATHESCRAILGEVIEISVRSWARRLAGPVPV